MPPETHQKDLPSESTSLANSESTEATPEQIAELAKEAPPEDTGPSLEDTLTSTFGEDAPDPAAGEAEKPAEKPAETPAEEGEAKPAEEAAPTLDDVDKDLGETTAPEATVEVDADAAPAPELRTAYKTLKQQVRDYETRLAANTVAQDKLKEAEKAAARAAELQKKLEATDYTQSDEFRRAYVAPIEDKLAQITAMTEGLKVTVADPDTGEEAEQDIDVDTIKRIFNTPLAQQGAVAKELTGDFAPMALAEVADLRKLNFAHANAVAKAGERAKEYQAKQVQERETRERQYREMYTGAQQEIEGKHPDLFGKKDDPITQRLQRTGEMLAEAAFRPPSDLTVDQLARVQASAALRVKNFGRVVADNRTLRQRNQQLEKLLAQARGSSPLSDTGVDAGGPSSGVEGSSGDDIYSALETVFKGS